MSTLEIGANELSEEEARAIGTRGKHRHSQTTRLQIVLGENSMERLDKLQDRVEPGTRTEVFRVALRVLESIIEELDKENELLIRDKSGKLHPYKVSLACGR